MGVLLNFLSLHWKNFSAIGLYEVVKKWSHWQFLRAKHSLSYCEKLNPQSKIFKTFENFKDKI